MDNFTHTLPTRRAARPHGFSSTENNVAQVRSRRGSFGGRRLRSRSRASHFSTRHTSNLPSRPIDARRVISICSVNRQGTLQFAITRVIKAVSSKIERLADEQQVLLLKLRSYVTSKEKQQLHAKLEKLQAKCNENNDRINSLLQLLLKLLEICQSIAHNIR